MVIIQTKIIKKPNGKSKETKSNKQAGTKDIQGTKPDKKQSANRPESIEIMDTSLNRMSKNSTLEYMMNFLTGVKTL